MRKGIFITGTNTGVGKTVITGLMARYLLDKGKRVITQKCVQTGCRGWSEDIEKHRQIAPGLADSSISFEKDIAPYVYKMPSSPHLASRLEDGLIKSDRIKNSYFRLQKNFDIVLVEGAGGVMVPLTEETLLIDLIKDLGLHVVVVVGNCLGAINHSLLTFEALKNRGIGTLGAIYNNLPGTDPVIIKDNVKIIRSISGVETLGTVCREQNIEVLYKGFREIAERLFSLIDGGK